MTKVSAQKVERFLQYVNFLHNTYLYMQCVATVCAVNYCFLSV